MITTNSANPYIIVAVKGIKFNTQARDNMANISQTITTNEFSSIKTSVFWKKKWLELNPRDPTDNEAILVEVGP